MTTLTKRIDVLDNDIDTKKENSYKKVIEDYDKYNDGQHKDIWQMIAKVVGYIDFINEQRLY